MNINQGEIWLVRFYPQTGSEVSKQRPAIVINHNTIGKLPLKVLVPVTEWKEKYQNYPWMIQLLPEQVNQLAKESAVDCFQLKNFSDQRFVKKLGEINNTTLEEIHATVVKVMNPSYKLTM